MQLMDLAQEDLDAMFSNTLLQIFKTSNQNEKWDDMIGFTYIYERGFMLCGWII